MAMRTGRFVESRKIVEGRTGVFYRILNSAEFNPADPDENTIVVTFGSGIQNQVEVRPTFSFDLVAQGDISVSGTGVVEGIYEALPNENVKSGRFKTRGTLVPTSGVRIIGAGSGSQQAVYRIFNSGSTEIQLWQTSNANGTGGTTFGPPLKENESFDFVTPANKLLVAKPAAPSTEHIEGIYDFIAQV